MKICHPGKFSYRVRFTNSLTIVLSKNHRHFRAKNKKISKNFVQNRILDTIIIIKNYIPVIFEIEFFQEKTHNLILLNLSNRHPWPDNITNFHKLKNWCSLCVSVVTFSDSRAVFKTLGGSNLHRQLYFL